jgi:hypothetical protein
MQVMLGPGRLNRLLGYTLGAPAADPPFAREEIAYDPRALVGARPFSEMRHVPRALRIPIVVAGALAIVVPVAWFVGFASETMIPLRGLVRGFFFAAAAGYIVMAATDVLEHIRLERELTGRVVAAQVVPLGETLLHVLLATTLVAMFSLSPAIRMTSTWGELFAVTAPIAFLLLSGIDELVYHRRRAQQREHTLHAIAHFSGAAMLVAFVTLQFVDWEAVPH